MSSMPRVLELGSSVAVGYCGRLLGMMGADVTRVDSPARNASARRSPVVHGPGGEPVSTLEEYLGCYKRSVVLDDTTPAGQEALYHLSRQADVIVEHHEGDPAPIWAKFEELRAVNPTLVYVVLSPFGLAGPYCTYKGNDFLDLAASGHLQITGDPDNEPLAAGGPWSGYVSGTIAAIGALAARHAAERRGRGRLLDIAGMEAMASLHQWSLLLYTHFGYVKGRWGNRMAESFYPYSFFQCSDGWVCIGTAGNPQWHGFCHALDMTEFLGDPRFETSADRFDRADELDATICPKLIQLTSAEAIARMQEHRVPAGPVLSVIETLLDDQLDSRGFWAAAPYVGPGATMPERAFHLPAEAPFTRAPRRGQHTAEVLVEAGVAEPVAAAVLAAHDSHQGG